MSPSRKQIRSSSARSTKTSTQNENSNDVLNRLDGLHSKAKEEHKKVAKTTTSNNNQIIAIVIIVVVASTGLVVLYNPNGIITNITGGASNHITSTLDGFQKDTLAQPLFNGGKLNFLYIGGQFCPYCGMERWAIVMALEQYGTFSNLQSLVSAEDKVPTYDFVGATYTSNVIQFDSFEVWNNVAPPNQAGLESLSSQASQLYSTYGSGSIPFICIGGSIFRSGAGSSFHVNSFSNQQFSTVQGQVNSKNGPLYNQISADSSNLVLLINQLLATQSTTTSATSTTTTSG